MLRVAVVILVIMLVYAGLYSLTALTAPKVVMKSSLEAVTGKTLENASDDGYLEPIMNLQRTAGIFAFATVMSGVFVLVVGFRKAQQWAWWGFLVIGGIAWLGGVIITAVAGDTMNMVLELIGLVLLILGLLLPIKSFFGQAGGTAEV